MHLTPHHRSETNPPQMSNKEHGNTLWKASCALFLALTLLLLSLFFSGQLKCDISTIMSLHESYPNHTNGYDNHTHDNQSLMTLKLNEMPQLKFNEIHQLWNIHFIHSFIESKLNHTFKYNGFYAQSQPSTVKLATEKSTGSLLAITNAVLKNLMDNSSNHTNSGNTSSIANSMHHKLLQIYRSIIILCSHTNETCNNQSLNDTLSTIAELYHHIATPDRAYYNIHMSRSAGTTICATFKVNGVTIPKHNCNIPGGRAFFFNRDQGQTSCEQKRSIQKTYGYKLVAAERPMHGNGVASHPELCDDFIYILSFRYPIERILSFIDMYTNMFASTMNKVNIFPPRKKSKIEEDRAGWVEKWNLTKNQDIFYRYFVKHEFDKHWSSAKSDAKYRIQGYMNNAVTRWIGYEWKQKQVYNATKRLLMGDIEKTDNALNKTQIALRVRNSILKSKNRTKFRRPDPSYFSYRSRVTSRKT